MNEKLTLLLIVNDTLTCKEIIDETAKNADSFTLAGVTNNPDRAMHYVTDVHPDAIILSIDSAEDNDNLSFLRQLKTAGIANPPYVAVIVDGTETAANKSAREYGADFIFSKSQDNFSAGGVIGFLKVMQPVIFARRPEEKDGEQALPEEIKEKRVNRRISNELDKLGMSPKSIGYRYLIDAIAIIMEQPVQHVCKIVSQKYGKTRNSVERAMQNAINRTWNSASEDELKANYTAKIKSSKGIPTITEFIFHYAHKLNNEF